LENLESCIDRFRGESDQVPSMFSALKYQGKPLYEYARQGIEVPREARKIKVYEIVLHRFEGCEVEMEIHCSKGTYIRTIVDDLGEMLGCGAHVTMLRRIGVANYPYEKMVTIDQLNEILEQAQRDDVAPKELLDPLLLPMDTAVEDLPEVNLNAELTDLIQHGMPVQVLGVPDGTVLKMTSGGQRTFIGVAELNDDGKVAPKRLVVFRNEAE
ncbi:tRNA pseudouridine synthase B, partial [Vibrio hepatarius]|uniref:tRNA pseudouridine synthase B n=1 Tax=Vibrio hepatarius TaxID=171383 RepID=UPI001C082592